MTDEPRILIIEDDIQYVETLMLRMEKLGLEKEILDLEIEHLHPSGELDDIDRVYDVVISDQDYSGHASFDGLEFLAGEAYEDDYLPENVRKILMTDNISLEMFEELEDDINLDQYEDLEKALEEVYGIRYCSKYGDEPYQELFDCIESFLS